MTRLGWFCAGFGAAVGLVLLLIIVVDVIWKQENVPTVSERVLHASLYRPAVAVVVTLILTGPVFLLLGHLFFPQKP